MPLHLLTMLTYIALHKPAAHKSEETGALVQLA